MKPFLEKRCTREAKNSFQYGWGAFQRVWLGPMFHIFRCVHFWNHLTHSFAKQIFFCSPFGEAHSAYLSYINMWRRICMSTVLLKLHLNNCLKETLHDTFFEPNIRRTIDAKNPACVTSCHLAACIGQHHNVMTYGQVTYHLHCRPLCEGSWSPRHQGSRAHQHHLRRWWIKSHPITCFPLLLLTKLNIKDQHFMQTHQSMPWICVCARCVHECTFVYVCLRVRVYTCVCIFGGCMCACIIGVCVCLCRCRCRCLSTGLAG